MKTLTIASIYTETVGISRPWFTPVGEFWIPGVPEGANAADLRARLTKPEILIVGENSQPYKQPVSGYQTAHVITPEELANDFIKHATTESPGMSQGCHPGVWICKGELPSQEEIAFWGRVQAIFMSGQIDKGNELATDPVTRKAITPGMRRAAMAYGREPEWLRPASDLDMTDCPYCQKSVPAGAATCSFCSNVVNFDRWAKLEATKKQALKNLTAA